MTALKVFSFIRGAIRGLNGWEDFSNTNFYVLGTEGIGKDLIKYIGSASDVSLYYTNTPGHLGLRDYIEILEENPNVEFKENVDLSGIDIRIDCFRETLTIKGRVFHFSQMKEDAYTQGIHEFYM